jgi:hypothetical protein
LAASTMLDYAKAIEVLDQSRIRDPYERVGAC